nr:twin-arginine translocation signal domain-containing protein [Gammaproteobacteria bacterium]NIS54446.1 twin-arginine translocation signal domain-containing protein [Phycisphaerae bacterium]
MALTRRRFLQLTGSAAVGVALGGCGFDAGQIKDHAQSSQLENFRESRTICPYCSVGCGAIVHTRLDGDQRTLKIEGDPDHVINRGALCSKGSGLYQFV